MTLNSYREPAQILGRPAATPRIGGSVVVGVLGAILFAALTFAGAHIRIPLQPVPITLQTLFVLLSGAVLGVRFGSLSQFVYLGLGVVGVPVFAGSLAGLGMLAGPTGGYLMGFVAAPLFVGAFIGRRDDLWWSLIVFSVGSLVVLALGVLHLTLFYTHSLADSLRVGFLPFLAGDSLKVLAAASIYRSLCGLRRVFARS